MRDDRFKVGLVVAAAIAAGCLVLLAGIELAQYRVAVRSHNLDVFYKSLTCDDLPLKGDTNVTACEQAIGKFMLRERGLFTR